MYVCTCLKVEAPRGAKKLDRSSDKDLKYAIDSLGGDSQGRRDSKVHYMHMYLIRLHNYKDYNFWEFYKLKSYTYHTAQTVN